MNAVRKLLSRLRKSLSGTAATEFALAAPVLLTAGLWGAESANQALQQMRVNQIAVLIADNASRVGENSLLGETKIYESDIDDLLYGATVQGGNSFDLYNHGRVILSSLEVVPNTDSDQYIHWQRCAGMKHFASTYGVAGDGLSSAFPGMGPAGQEITADKGEAVMFVEVEYDYQPIIGAAFTTAKELHAIAAFNVRQNRDLTQVYQRDTNNPAPVASCDQYNGASALVS
ncbi:TadE/TadG family type IV pilus assembly protein [Tsuneonella mangrovi]|uniref:TadE/TadG family type IV pilus assembly protein n=1 Tax=Tsuneonella mangrovi TaxID=1982042 RepID=UPI000BA1E010|nr:tight adherence protein TadE [Tsuneonella mangrovi]